MAHDPTALPDFVSACETATRVRDLWALALDFFHARGIDKISYHSSPANGCAGTSRPARSAAEPPLATTWGDEVRHTRPQRPQRPRAPPPPWWHAEEGLQRF